MTGGIQIESHKDHVISAAPIVKVDVPLIDLEEDRPAKSSDIPLPQRSSERKNANLRDDQSELSSDGEFLLLRSIANPKRIKPPEEITMGTSKDYNSKENTERCEADDKRRSRDSDSEADMRSQGSWRSHHSRGSNDSLRSEYKPRYSRPTSPTAVDTAQTDPGAKKRSELYSELFKTGLFSTTPMSEDEMMKEKTFLLREYGRKNADYQYNSTRLNLSDDIVKIKYNLDTVNLQREIEASTGLCKKGLLFAVNMLVCGNRWFKDPLGIDGALSMWKIDMNWDIMKEGKLDDPLEEIMASYRGKLPMGPYGKIALYMGGSLVEAVIQHKDKQADADRLAEEERRQNERVQNMVRQEMMRMQMLANQDPRQQQQHQPQQQEPAQKHYFPNPNHSSNRYQQANAPLQSQIPLQSQVPLHGPSYDADEIKRLLQEQNEFIDMASDASSVRSSVGMKSHGSPVPSTYAPSSRASSRGNSPEPTSIVETKAVKLSEDVEKQYGVESTETIKITTTPRKKAGRPAGSKNKATAQTTDAPKPRGRPRKVAPQASSGLSIQL